MQGDREKNSEYWKATWDTLVEIMRRGATLPNDVVDANSTSAIRAMSEKLWQLELQDQRAALAVLTQLCDCLVWWTQKYK